MVRDVIKVIDVTKHFKGITALNRVSLSILEGQISGIIGPNGAGKTTLLNTINGIYKPDGGQVYFKDISLNRLKVYEIAQLGISRTFQIVRIFRRLSVLENMFTSSIHLADRKKQVRDKALELLNFVGLLDKKDQYAHELSGGQQKLLEFARALMPDPQVILMDEPFAGVHPEIKARLMNNIKEINKNKDKTLIVISHDMQSIKDLCDRLVVLNFGEKLVEGIIEEVLADDRVINAYLGEQDVS